MQPAPQQNTLLQACSLLFLFRALAATRDEGNRAILESQIIGLIADLVPCNGGAVRLVDDDAEVAPPPGSIPIEMPLLTQGVEAGVLSVWFSASHADHLAEYQETLGAVATLATVALDTVRDIERLQTENQLLR